MIRLAKPCDRHVFGMWSSGTRMWPAYVLLHSYTVKDVKIILIRPISPHADAKIGAAPAHKIAHSGAMLSHYPITAVAVSNTSWKAHNIHIIKKICF
jgi:hypothetical protein